jgi:tetrahydromethanopterin S-methyltransferase subunit E
VTGLFGVIAGANNYWSVSWDVTFGASHQFKDFSTGFGIPVTIYGPFTSVTDTGVSRTYYTAITVANVGTSNFQPYFST